LGQKHSKDYDVIINLCGYAIAKKRWSPKVKNKIISSRVESTQKLVKFIGKQKTVLMNASAIGVYPFSDDVQDEQIYLSKSTTNSGFCQEITAEWEKQVNDALVLNKIIMRFGVVLGDKGMLTKVLPTSKIGLGAQIGTGQQYLSWVHIDDLCRAIEYLIKRNDFNGEAINLTSPFACTQKNFINSLCRILKKPCWMQMPEWVVKKLFGQMGEELLLSSHNIKPKKLCEADFKFKYPKIESALGNLLDKES
jgi:uncharacterized protein